MPCWVTGSPEGDAALDAQEARREATEVTDMLCTVLRRIEKQGTLYAYTTTRIQQWWEKHKNIDNQKEVDDRSSWPIN